jgi:serine/threonine protein kinase
VVGTILGNRYRILRELGSGGMAWVYLAEDTLNSGFVAVKVLYPQLSEDMAYLQRFVREAKIAGALTDPRIVKVLDYGSTRGVHYLVMEYISGLDLKAVLESRGKLTWQEGLSISRDVALALDHASKFGIVHRDIKPQNLMIGDDGVVKVLDFGIARASTLPAITQSGLIGSPYYVSPEQAMGEPVDIRSDLYSLGVVLFEMIAGEAPFRADNAWSIISQHIADEPRLVRTLAPDAPLIVEQLLSIALMKRKEDRFQTPSAFVAAIDAALTDGQLPEKDLPEVQEPVVLEEAISEMYCRGLEALRTEQFDTALQLFSRVSHLSPGYLDSEAQLNRTLEYFQLEELYAAALQARGDENWGLALAALRQIQALRVGYKDSEHLLAEVELVVAPTHVAESHPARLAAIPVEAAPQAQLDILDYPEESDSTRARDLLGWLGGSNTARYRGLIVMAVLALFLGAGLLAVSGMIDQARSPTVQQRYEQAMALFNQGQWKEAIQEFERIQSMSPNYEDVAARKEEATKFRELDRLYGEGQAQYQAGHWAEAITLLTQVRAQDLSYRESALTSALCAAYYQQGLAESNASELKALHAASALLGQGLEVCPTHADMLALKKWTADYLQALLDVGDGQLERAIEELTALNSLEPGSTDPRIAPALYQAYVRLAQNKEDEGNLSQALANYKRALAVPGIEHSQIEAKRAALEKQLTAITPSPAAESKPVTPEPRTTPTASPTPSISPTLTLPSMSELRYPPPKLISPASDTVFNSGQFEKIVLKWSGPDKLAPGEYYDVSILHFFNNEPVYWGTYTEESQLELTPDIGYSKADKDIFHWFVTIRSTQRVSRDGKPDGPAISPKSLAFTFVWR